MNKLPNHFCQTINVLLFDKAAPCPPNAVKVKEACDRLTAELQDLKGSLLQSQQKQRKSGSLVQELTTMVREQKKHIQELIRCKKEAVTALKVQMKCVGGK